MPHAEIFTQTHGEPLPPERLLQGKEYLRRAPRAHSQVTEIEGVPGVSYTITAVNDTLLGQFNDQGPAPYGTSLGGTRVVFEEDGYTPQSAERLAQILASDMTKKHFMLYTMMNALKNKKLATEAETLATMMGGSKSVILAKNKAAFPKRGSEARRELFRQHAEHILRMGEAITAVDMYTETADMDVVAEVTGGRFVACQSVEKGGTGNPSPTTAAGVWHGAEMLLRSRGIDPKKAHYAISGIGAVGRSLVELIAYQPDAHPTIYLADTITQKALDAKDELKHFTDAKFILVDPAEIHKEKVDIFMPNALAEILTQKFLHELHPEDRIIAGGANDPWPMRNDGPDPEIVDAYNRKGIAVAPAWVINMGGILHVSRMFWKNWGGPAPDEARARELVAGVAALINTIDSLAKQRSQPMEVVASDMVAETLVRHALVNGIPLT